MRILAYFPFVPNIYFLMPSSMIHKFLFHKSVDTHMQFLRYFFVGGSAAVVDLLVFTTLVEYANFHYILAAFIAYMCGLIWNHILCVVWIFESKHQRMRELLTVFGIALGGLLWTWLILYVAISLLGIDEVIAKMISQILVLFWNFSLRKFYVFH